MKALKQTMRATLAAAVFALAAAAFTNSQAVAEPQAAVPVPHSAVPGGPGAMEPPPPTGAAPQPRLTLSPRSPLIGFGAMVALLGVVIAISFIPSKRGHQD